MSLAREVSKSKSVPREFSGAPRGMIKNAPHDSLPAGSVAYLRNAHAFATEFQPRLSPLLLGVIAPPALEGRTGYSAYKSGTTVVSLSGPIFSVADTNRFFTWPDGGSGYGYHDYILEYLTPTTVRVRDNEDRVPANGCYIHAKLNLWKGHSAVKKLVYQFGNEVYVADMATPTVLVKALVESVDAPSDSVSDWSEMDKLGVIYNSNGIYIVDFEPTIPRVWRANTPVATATIVEVAYAPTKPYRYDYLFGMQRLQGEGIIRDRTTPGAKIMQETGTNELKTVNGTAKDYATVWTDKTIGPDLKTHGVLTGSILPNVSLDAAGVWETITDGVAKFTIDGTTHDVWMNFDNVTTMLEVAEVVQAAIRLYWPDAKCTFGANKFVVMSGLQGSTIDHCDAGSDGTDVAGAGYLGLTQAAGAGVQNNVPYVGPVSTQWLQLPANDTDPTTIEQHWTHYAVYRTTDIGPYGVEPRVAQSQDGGFIEEVPLKFTWVMDVRVSGAFMARRYSNDLVEAVLGEFELADVGTPLVWEDGDIDTIYEFVDSKHVYVSTGALNYYDATKKLQAAAIGGGRVIRATQNGYEVTRSKGAYFTAADVGKRLTWSTGAYSLIAEYVDPNTVIVHNSATMVSQGLTLGETKRAFNDTVTDDVLRSRQGELHVGELGHRFYAPLPNGNVGCTVPGFMIVAVRGLSKFYYCQLGVQLKYMAGYYLPNRQTCDRIEGGIQAIRKMPNKYVVLCQTSTWGGPTNKAQINELPEFGEFYAVLQIDIVDARVGVTDIGSIQEVDFGVLEMRCSDNSWRQFDGYKFGPDLSVDPETGQDRVKKDFTECWDESASAYGDNIGHILWLRKKE